MAERRIARRVAARQAQAMKSRSTESRRIAPCLPVPNPRRFSRFDTMVHDYLAQLLINVTGQVRNNKDLEIHDTRRANSRLQ